MLSVTGLMGLTDLGEAAGVVSRAQAATPEAAVLTPAGQPLVAQLTQPATQGSTDFQHYNYFWNNDSYANHYATLQEAAAAISEHAVGNQSPTLSSAESPAVILMGDTMRWGMAYAVGQTLATNINTIYVNGQAQPGWLMRDGAYNIWSPMYEDPAGTPLFGPTTTYADTGVLIPDPLNLAELSVEQAPLSSGLPCANSDWVYVGPTSTAPGGTGYETTTSDYQQWYYPAGDGTQGRWYYRGGYQEGVRDVTIDPGVVSSGRTPTTSDLKENSLYNAWCVGPLDFYVTWNPQTPTPVAEGNRGGMLTSTGQTFLVDSTQEMRDKYGVSLFASSKNVTGSANTSEVSAVALDPKLTVVKEICTLYDDALKPICTKDSDAGWVKDSTAGDGDGIEQGWLPAGVTEVMWRVTGQNTGNVPLGHISAVDKVTLQPQAGTTAPTTVTNNCNNARFEYTFGGGTQMFYDYAFGSSAEQAALDAYLWMPGESDSLVCTTELSSPFSGTILNSVGLNADFDCPGSQAYRSPNYLDENGNLVTMQHRDRFVGFDNGIVNPPDWRDHLEDFHADAYPGKVPSNVDSAEGTTVTPAIKLTKWVCDEASNGGPCTAAGALADTDLAKMGGVVGSSPDNHQGTTGLTYGVTQGAGVGGWAKEATVPYNTAADWLVVISNTGSTRLDLAGATVTDQLVQELGASGVSCGHPAKGALLPGESTYMTCTTTNITNTGTVKTGDDGAKSAAYGEPGYNAGTDTVLNQVSITGVSAQYINPDGSYLQLLRDPTQPDTSANRVTVNTNISAAEANSAVNPAVKVTKYVCETGTGCAPPDLAKLSGVTKNADGTLTVAAGDPSGPWVKQTTVAYDGAADWIVVVTNIGDTALADFTLKDTLVKTWNSDGTPDETQALSPALVGTVPTALAPGDSIYYTAQTTGVDTSEPWDAGVRTDPGAIDPVSKEPTYLVGTDWVNEASVTAQPVDTAGDPLPAANLAPGAPAADMAKVTSNESSAEVRAGSFGVGDYVWIDQDPSGANVPTNNDGLQNGHEVGLDGVTVTLYQDVSGAWTKKATTTTTAGGYYYFDELVAGRYYVAFTLPGTDYVWTKTGAGNVALDSDAVQPGTAPNDATRQSAPFDIGAGKPNMVAATDQSLPLAKYQAIVGDVAADSINPTIDAGLVKPAPGIDIEKYDAAGPVAGDHDWGTPPAVLTPGTPTPITFTITNNGNEPLVKITVSDKPGADSSTRMTNITCQFPGAPVAGTTATYWPGPFAAGASFTCTGTVPALASGDVEADTATAAGEGQYTGKPVTDDDTWRGEVPSYAVGDYVWLDTNKNGIQDAGETPVKGATVYLLDASGNRLATTTTGTTGLYVFDKLAPGTYQVGFVLPVEYADWTLPLQGSDQADSDAVNAKGTDRLSQPFTLGDPVADPTLTNMTPKAGYTLQSITAGYINQTIDAGVIGHEPGIDVTKYDKLTGDWDASQPGLPAGDHNTADDPSHLTAGQTTTVYFTIKNTGDEPLVNVVVKDNPAGSLSSMTCFFAGGSGPGTVAVKSADGTTWEAKWAGPLAVGASFDCQGTAVAVQAGDTTSDTATASGDGVYSGEPASDHDDWNGEVPAYAVGDFMWVDANHNGIQDAGEAPVPGAPVYLLKADGSPYLGTDGKPMATTTGADGYYHFEPLPAGNYRVGFGLPPNGPKYGWTTTGTGTAATDSNAIEVTTTGRMSAVFTLGDPVANPALTNMAPVATYPYRTAIKDADVTYVDPTLDAGVYLPEPGIDIEKTSATGDHDSGTTPAVMKPGESVPITFTITNEGDEPLVNVVVTDTPAGTMADMTCFFGGSSQPGTPAQKSADGKAWEVKWAGPFAPGATFTCTGTEVAIASASSTSDEATVTGSGEYTGKTPTDTDTWNGETPSYAVGDFVWIDQNQNGIQDDGEAPMPGVTVTLYRVGETTPVDSTPTTAAGYYWFDGLAEGTYYVTFGLPAGYFWTGYEAVDSTPENDSDGNWTSPADKTARSGEFALGPDAPRMEASAAWAALYATTLTADLVNPTVDAGVIPVAPGLDLAKYVCKTGTGCEYPTTDSAWTPDLLAPPSGWVKATTVTYGTGADWLILVENTGNIPLANVRLTVEDFKAGGGGFTNDNCGPTTGWDQPLLPGEFLIIACTITNVTNTAALGSGQDIINTAGATGDVPPEYGGGDVTTKDDSAEVNTTPPPKAKTGGSVVGLGSTPGVAALVVAGLGLAAGLVLLKRRRS
ncbi:MAG: carboxypeptidase regulatory-like domain-containing protein [Propionibacteriaceae bacterium]|nr:carboxypeptidase regulatory-like domain-containing protein [Propionibacteriaceae bacterium]